MNLIQWFWKALKTNLPLPSSKQRAKVSKIGQNSIVWRLRNGQFDFNRRIYVF